VPDVEAFVSIEREIQAASMDYETRDPELEALIRKVEETS